MEDEMTASAPTALVAGFWRRMGAFAIDWIILALSGNALGQLLFDQLAAMGGGARVIGFAIATVAFGVTESRIGGGASPGKRALGLRVVDGSGRFLSPARALLRAAIFLAPIMFNGMIANLAQAPVGLRAISGLAGSLCFASFYLLAFNRRNRQGIHDILVGSFVIRQALHATGMARRVIWRPHLLIASLIAVTGIPLSVMGMPVFFSMAPSVATRATSVPSTGMPELKAATILWTPPSGANRICKEVNAQLAGAGIDDADIARNLSGQLARHYQCRIGTSVRVHLFYGFDLGFAAGRKYRDYTFARKDYENAP